MNTKIRKLKTLVWSMIYGVMHIEDTCSELRSRLVSDDTFCSVLSLEC